MSSLDMYPVKMLVLKERRWTWYTCQTRMASTASRASPPWAALAAGMKSPGSTLAVAIGFHSMKPVTVMITVPHTIDQYSSFSSQVNLPCRGRLSLRPRL